MKQREGGIIWHTQGSGKSLTMVWLARWIREHVTFPRVLLITDRTELDEQIESVFKGVSEAIHRTSSGADLVRVLNSPEEWLIGSLVHKFGASEEISEKDVEAYVEEIRKNLPRGFHPKGEIFVFVDECHRTQSGKLHEAMKALLPGAMLIGFTGTPLLREDKQRSIETFGTYIHTYKYDEAVSDGVVLDLRYEARDIDQEHHVAGQDRSLVRPQDPRADRPGEGPAQAALGHDAEGPDCEGSAGRKIVADILFDMETRDRLENGRGKRPARLGQHLLGVPFLRDVSGARSGRQVRHRHLVQAGPGGHQGGGDRRGPHRKAAAAYIGLPEDARGALQRAGRNGDGQGRDLRKGGEATLHQNSRGR